MSELFLTDDEICTLTDYKRPAEQIRWLRDNGFACVEGRSGKPKVLRAELERHLVGSNGRGARSASRSPSLDLSAITAKGA